MNVYFLLEEKTVFTFLITIIVCIIYVAFNSCMYVTKILRLQQMVGNVSESINDQYM